MKHLIILLELSLVFITSCDLLPVPADFSTKIPFNRSACLSDSISLQLEPKDWLTGIAISTENITYRSWYTSNIYTYDTKTQKNTSLIDDCPGYYLAQDTNYVFYELGSKSIWRYNLKTQKTDLKFDLSNFDNQTIDGLALFNNFLYVNLHSYPNERQFNLVKFDLDGNIVEITDIDRPLSYMAIYDNVLYSRLYNSKKSILLKYDLEKNVFLDEIPLDNEITGFCFYNDRFYYVDCNNKQVRYLELSIFPH